MRNWFTIKAAAAGAEILIYDEIGGFGVSATEFDKQLKALGAVPTITLRINSPGGDVFAASAIYSMLERHPARIVAYIDGVAASAASFIAMAADEVVMPANALMMIHDPRGGAVGTSNDMREWADTLDRIAQAMATAYAKKSGRSIDDVLALMKAETWMNAEDAIRMGFADRVERPVQVAAHHDLSRYSGAPPAAEPKSMAELADAYWGGRQAADAPVQATGDDGPDLTDLVEDIDPVAIYAKFNGAKRPAD